MEDFTEGENPPEDSTNGKSIDNKRKRTQSESDETLAEPAAKVPKIGTLDPQECGICKEPITTQLVGRPDCCDHKFCFACLIEWNKRNNICPYDRKTFNAIVLRKSNAKLGDLRNFLKLNNFQEINPENTNEEDSSSDGEPDDVDDINEEARSSDGGPDDVDDINEEEDNEEGSSSEGEPDDVDNINEEEDNEEASSSDGKPDDVADINEEEDNEEGSSSEGEPDDVDNINEEEDNEEASSSDGEPDDVDDINEEEDNEEGSSSEDEPDDVDDINKEAISSNGEDNKTEENDDLECSLCENNDSDELIHRCFYCEAGFHLSCLTPPATEIPNLFEKVCCPKCKERPLLDFSSRCTIL